MQEDLSPPSSRTKRIARALPGWPLVLAGLAVMCACAIYVHERGIAGAWTFIGVASLSAALLWFNTFMLDSWFGRPTHGTSGAIGMFYLWCAARLIFFAAIAAVALIGLCGYSAAYMATLIVCGILDTIFIFTSL